FRKDLRIERYVQGIPAISESAHTEFSEFHFISQASRTGTKGEPFPGGVRRNGKIRFPPDVHCSIGNGKHIRGQRLPENLNRTLSGFLGRLQLSFSRNGVPLTAGKAVQCLPAHQEIWND